MLGLGRRTQGRAMGAAVAVATACALGACGSDDDSGTSSAATAADSSTAAAKSIDVGTSKIPVESDKLTIAYFAAGTNNSYLQAQQDEAKKWAAANDAELQVFDGKFDATAQFNQIQNAIQSGRFNAALAQPNDPQLECEALSEKAPKAGIVVSVTILPLCGKTVNEGDGLWAPGTLNFIGGTHTYKYFKAYFDRIVEENPGPQKVVGARGPALSPITVNFKKALEDIQAEHPEFKVVGDIETDYSVPGSQQKAAPVFQANKDATILISAYSNITKGAMQALKQQGKLGKVKIYDKGATSWAKEQVESGAIQSTVPEYARTSIRVSLDSLKDAFNGKEPKRVYLNDGAELPPEADPTGLNVLTKENIASFVPESD